MSAVFEPTRHKLSIDDYVRLSEAGILGPDARVELIEGDLIEMPPIGPGHASVSSRLNRLLVRGTGDEAIVSTVNPLRLPPRSMPEPDFMLLQPRADDYATEHPDSDDPLGAYRTVLSYEAPFRIAPMALPNLLVESRQIWPPSID